MSQSEVDMTQVFQRMRQAVDQLSQAWATAARSIADSMPEPVKAEQPERFQHTDTSGDRVLVYPHDYPEFQSVLMVETVGCDSVRLSQEAVNRLAQCLDRYRTDQQDCEGPCSPDTNGAPVTYPLPTGFDRCTGTYEGFRCRRSVNHEGEHA